jgi:hypothetical protein
MSRQLNPRTASLLRLRVPVALRRRSTRDLQIERLESRVVLSGLSNVEVPVPAAAQLVETRDTVELAVAVPSIDTATTNVALAQNAAGTVAAADSTLTTAALVSTIPVTDVALPAAPTVPTRGPGGPSGSGQPVLPPIIIEFDAACQNGVWLFSGRVLDDADVTGLTIHFGGVLAGRTATVNDEGCFELIITLGPGISGFATAYTIDRNGLKSEIESVRVN